MSDKQPTELSISQAAALANLTRQGVHSARRAGRFSARRVGHVWLVDGESFNRYLAERKLVHAPKPA